jgi:uncharacterized protein YdaU (DUF1376 family)
MSKKPKTDIWMPIYIGDYLSATTRLTTEQHGAYLLLLMDYWKNGPLPDNDQVLSQITRMSLDAWSNTRSILESFFELSGKHWVHKRVEKELEEAQSRKEKATIRAKAGAEARWNKENALSIAQALPSPMLADASSPSPSSSSLTSKSIKTSSRQAAVLCPEGVSDQVWKDFVATRGKSAVTETALKGIAREAQKAGWSLEAALQECAIRGWRGFKAEWVNKTSNGYMINKQEALEARNRAVGDAWLKKMEIEENANI